MNKDRRNQLADAASQIDDIIDAIIDVQSEEQDAYDNMPEGFQNGERGQSMLEAMEMMDEFISDLEAVRDKIDDYAQ